MIGWKRRLVKASFHWLAHVARCHLFDESLGLDRDGFMCAMFLQDTDGADAALTYATVHLRVNTAALSGPGAASGALR